MRVGKAPLSLKFRHDLRLLAPDDQYEVKTLQHVQVMFGVRNRVKFRFRFRFRLGLGLGLGLELGARVRVRIRIRVRIRVGDRDGSWSCLPVSLY